MAQFGRSTRPDPVFYLPEGEMMVKTDPSPTIHFSDEFLDNGLRLIMSEDHLAPITAVNLWYNVGSRNETKGRTGLAHLFEHMMFEGSGNVAKGEHSKMVTAAGGAMNGSTWLHRTNYFEWAPSHHLELLLWLEADRMGSLLNALNQETLDNQRDVVKNERRSSVDNRPYGNWLEKMQGLLFPEGHPYHHEVLGSMEDLSAASLEDVKNFFRTYYAPNNAVLSIVGDFEPNQTREWVERYFGPIQSNPSVPPPPTAAVSLDLGGEVREIVQDRVPLARIYVGFRSHPDGSRENDVVDVLGAVLALGKGSRLYRRLVRDRMLAQDAQVFTIGQQEVSMTLGWATARPGVDLEELEEAFIATIESVIHEPITDDELIRAKAQIERRVLDHLMTVASRADWLSENATVFGDPSKVNERLPSLLSVTSEEIPKIAAEVFSESNRAVLTYVPKEEV